MWRREEPRDKYSGYNNNPVFNLETKFEDYEQELRQLAEQPFFARVNNRTVASVGDIAYLPCRVKFIQPGYTVSEIINTLPRQTLPINFPRLKCDFCAFWEARLLQLIVSP